MYAPVHSVSRAPHQRRSSSSREFTKLATPVTPSVATMTTSETQVGKSSREVRGPCEGLAADGEGERVLHRRGDDELDPDEAEEHRQPVAQAHGAPDDAPPASQARWREPRRPPWSGVSVVARILPGGFRLTSPVRTLPEEVLLGRLSGSVDAITTCLKRVEIFALRRHVGATRFRCHHVAEPESALQDLPRLPPPGTIETPAILHVGRWPGWAATSVCPTPPCSSI